MRKMTAPIYSDMSAGNIPCSPGAAGILSYRPDHGKVKKIAARMLWGYYSTYREGKKEYDDMTEHIDKNKSPEDEGGSKQGKNRWPVTTGFKALRKTIRTWSMNIQQLPSGKSMFGKTELVIVQAVSE